MRRFGAGTDAASTAIGRDMHPELGHSGYLDEHADLADDLSVMDGDSEMDRVIGQQCTEAVDGGVEFDRRFGTDPPPFGRDRLSQLHRRRSIVRHCRRIATPVDGPDATRRFTISSPSDHVPDHAGVLDGSSSPSLLLMAPQ